MIHSFLVNCEWFLVQWNRILNSLCSFGHPGNNERPILFGCVRPALLCHFSWQFTIYCSKSPAVVRLCIVDRFQFTSSRIAYDDHGQCRRNYSGIDHCYITELDQLVTGDSYASRDSYIQTLVNAESYPILQRRFENDWWPGVLNLSSWFNAQTWTTNNWSY